MVGTCPDSTDCWTEAQHRSRDSPAFVGCAAVLCPLANTASWSDRLHVVSWGSGRFSRQAWPSALQQGTLKGPWLTDRTAMLGLFHLYLVLVHRLFAGSSGFAVDMNSKALGFL